MTVIAWDGQTLAADKRCTTGGHHFTTRKIFRVGDCLVGFSGAADRWGSLVHWLESGRDPARYPTNPPDDSSFMLVIHPDGRIERFEDTPWPILIEERHFAAGSGKAYALATMHLGGTATQAVEVASRFDECCGNGIDTLSFDREASQ